jgi:hypothetical protein
MNAAPKVVMGIVRPDAGKKGRGEESSGVFRVLRTLLLSLFSSFLAYDDS